MATVVSVPAPVRGLARDLQRDPFRSGAQRSTRAVRNQRRHRGCPRHHRRPLERHNPPHPGTSFPGRSATCELSCVSVSAGRSDPSPNALTAVALERRRCLGHAIWTAQPPRVGVDPSLHGWGSFAAWVADQHHFVFYAVGRPGEGDRRPQSGVLGTERVAATADHGRDTPADRPVRSPSNDVRGVRSARSVPIA